MNESANNQVDSKTTPIEPVTIDACILDQLVDGELDASRRRELFEELERAPQGWRQCALAFLEAQAWRDALARPVGTQVGESREIESNVRVSTSALHKEVALPSPAIPSVGTNVPSGNVARTFHRRALKQFALAASVLVAFGLGMALRTAMFPSLRIGNTQVATDRSPQTNSAFARGNRALGETESLPSTETLPEAAPRETEFLVFKQLHDAENRQVRLPVVSREQLVSQWAQQAASESDSPLLRALFAGGHRLVPRRTLVSVRLNDGRIAEIPLEQYEIEDLAGSYQ